jgi:hypothetical protein
MAILPSDISLPKDLTSILGQIGTPQQAKITDIYGRMRKQASADTNLPAWMRVRPGGYTDTTLSKGENISQAGLKSGLEGVLGETGYGDWKAERDYQQNMALAKRIGDLMAPSLLEQVLGGLGGGAQAGGQMYGLFKGFSKPSSTQYAETGPMMNYYDPYSSGYARYS